MVGVVVTVFLAGMGVAAGADWPAALRRVGRGSRVRRRGRRRIEIAFYRRFETSDGPAGAGARPARKRNASLRRPPGIDLASLTGESRLAALPAVVADAFYRVRFGRTPLDNLQTQAVEQALVGNRGDSEQQAPPTSLAREPQTSRSRKA